MNFVEPRSYFFSIPLAGLVLGMLMGLSGPARAQAKIELRLVELITLSTKQFLIGDNNGKAASLAGELRIPKPGNERLPAVILIHGSGGISALHDRWVRELNSAGLATFILDSFSGRGITDTINDQSQLDNIVMMVDAFRALASLARHPRIDPNRISVMGFSKGAVAAVYSSNERFRKMYGPQNVQFAAHIGLYTPCNVVYKDDDKVTGKPIRLFHGMNDNWVSIEPCRAYVARLKTSGADVVLSEYPEATHAYDNPALKEQVQVPQAQTLRHCSLIEGEAGTVLNSKTLKEYDLKDACVERGTTIAYNEEATIATTKAVKEFLTSIRVGGT